jgi:hypothetical protein
LFQKTFFVELSFLVVCEFSAAAPYLRDAGKKEIESGKKPQNRCIINVRLTTLDLHCPF